MGLGGRFYQGSRPYYPVVVCSSAQRKKRKGRNENARRQMEMENEGTGKQRKGKGRKNGGWVRLNIQCTYSTYSTGRQAGRQAVSD